MEPFDDIGDNKRMADIDDLRAKIDGLEGSMNELAGAVRTLRDLVGPLQEVLGWVHREQAARVNYEQWRADTQAQLEAFREEMERDRERCLAIARRGQVISVIVTVCVSTVVGLIIGLWR